MAPTRRPWGGYDICHGRHGMTRYRLVVCPPGITAGRRRRLVLWRNWPLWGAALWVGLELFARHETVWKRVYEEVGV
ncbi:hypothetical protein SAMN05445060_4217 [Williamsia sterculiae]|uniref:Uncharacterized protein n=2 Tax=Williamsia sterculiae TaxID=1344003 RepID=A0A1N7HGR4_9NOCA|nr:hypothetical protein SAMN05445060_4217 [Williamsia sterculiae]